MTLFAIFGQMMLGGANTGAVLTDETDYKSYSNAFRNSFFMTTLSNYPYAAEPYLL